MVALLIKKISVCLFLLVFFVFNAQSAFSEHISAKGYILINAQTNETVSSKNSDLKLSMASTTKIMTSLLAVESGKLHCVVTSQKDLSIEGTAVGIKKGDSFTLETLVYAMLLESGNDAAVLTAEYLAGSEEAFSVLMNKKAEDIGMLSTNFVTASGLDSDEHYTTAYDMAILTSYAIKNPEFKKICSTKSYTAKQIKPAVSFTYSNHNRLLGNCEGVFGVKTGFTKKSGRCLVSACERDGITLIAVTLNAPDDWNDHKKLYDYGYSTVKKNEFKIEFPNKIKIYGSDKKEISLKCNNTEGITFDKETVDVSVRLKDFVYAPVKENEIIGCIDFHVDGKLVKSDSIFACESAEPYNSDAEPEFSFLYKFKQFFKN